MTVKFISGANIKKYHPCGQSSPIPISQFGILLLKFLPPQVKLIVHRDL